MGRSGLTEGRREREEGTPRSNINENAGGGKVKYTGYIDPHYNP